jgi:ribonuclease VapC
MILDASAIIAILRMEPEAESFARAIADSKTRVISAVNYVEAAIIIDSARNPIASRRFDDFLREAEIVIEPVTGVQARIVREAYRDFGKGTGHAASLNLGDCFAYALAKSKRAPLLFKGPDFSHTDVTAART